MTKSLDRAFEVDQAINHADTDFVIIRFGAATDRDCKEVCTYIQPSSPVSFIDWLAA